VTPELAATLAAVDLAVFIDASQNGPIGRIECQLLESETGGLPFTHGCGIAALPELARQLYGRAPTVYLLTARGGSFDLHDGRLSPATEAMVRPMVERTLALLADDGRDR
jgi:Ni,Fe-hydrogenase maturation factor